MPIFTLERVEGRIFRPVALTYAFALGGALLFTLTAVPALTAALLKHRPVEREASAVPHLAAGPLPRRAARDDAAARPDGAGRRWPVIARGDDADAAPRLRVPAADERGRHPHHGHDAQRRLAGAAAPRCCATCACTLLKFPEVKDVLSRAGPPRGRHRRRGAEPVRDVRDHEARGRLAEGGRAARSAAIEGRDRRGDARRAGSAGRRLQLQPADQGPRRGVNLRHPRPGRREDLRRRPGPDAPEAGRGEGDHRRRRAARATSTSTARAARSTSSPTSIARRPRATACRCATSRTPSRARSAASWRRRCGRASAASACASRLPIADRGRSGVGRAAGDPDGARAPAAGALAKLHLDSGRTQINREQGQRFLALKCNIEGRDMGSFVAEAQAHVASSVKLPEGYHLTWGGEFENQRRAMKRLAVHRADLGAGDLLPALHDLPRDAAGAGRAAGRSVRDRGRRVRAVSDAGRSCRSRRRSGSSRCSACR